MKLARKILVKTLGLKGYLSFVSKTYIRMIQKGKMKDQYQELYFIEKAVKEGDVVMDIGANLAYYSFFMSKYMGDSGQLLAVEPIPLFADIWKKNMSKATYKNYKLFNCALGSEPQDKVKMSIPIVNGVVRHGLTSVEEEGNDGSKAMSFEVPMMVGDSIIEGENPSKLDYIKCDVEGYEQYVIPSLDKSIEKFHPMLQIELSGKENRERVVDYLLKKGYSIFILENDLLNPIQKNDIFSVNQDFYFIHQENQDKKGHLIRNN